MTYPHKGGKGNSPAIGRQEWDDKHKTGDSSSDDNSGTSSVKSSGREIIYEDCNFRITRGRYYIVKENTFEIEISTEQDVFGKPVWRILDLDNWKSKEDLSSQIITVFDLQKIDGWRKLGKICKKIEST